MSRNWRLLLSSALLLGAIFRFAFPADIEWDGDVDYMVDRVQNVGIVEPFPWLGMPSAVQVQNPGMSVWVFLLLGKLSGAQDAVRLSQAVQALNWLALVLLALFAIRCVAADERESWLWAVALACVNPIAVLFHRKVWAQSVLPIFCIFFLWGWWNRRKASGSFVLGFMGLCLAQIHMSGFFIALGVSAWAFVLRRKEIRWPTWIAGSTLGFLPMIPWINYFLTNRPKGALIYHLSEVVQFKFWVFWITNPLGLHVGNVIGVYRGPSLWDQLGDFLRYPWVDGMPTYGVAIAHAVILALALGTLIKTAVSAVQPWNSLIEKNPSETTLATRAWLWGYGPLLTLSSICIRRYYMIITFPLEWVFLARWWKRVWGTRSQPLLFALFAAQIMITTQLLLYLHVNGGAQKGAYGPSFAAQKQGVPRP